MAKPDPEPLEAAGEQVFRYAAIPVLCFRLNRKHRTRLVRWDYRRSNDGQTNVTDNFSALAVSGGRIKAELHFSNLRLQHAAIGSRVAGA